MTESTCTLCNMTAMNEQWDRSICCLTQGCPMPKADAAGKIYSDAAPADRKKMTGIIIGQKPQKKMNKAGAETEKTELVR